MPRPPSEKLIVKGRIAPTETLNAASRLPLLGQFVCKTLETGGGGGGLSLLFLCLVFWTLSVALQSVALRFALQLDAVVFNVKADENRKWGLCDPPCQALCWTAEWSRRDGLCFAARDDDAPNLTTSWSRCSAPCQSPLPTRVFILGVCTKKCPTSKVESITRRISAS